MIPFFNRLRINGTLHSVRGSVKALIGRTPATAAWLPTEGLTRSKAGCCA